MRTGAIVATFGLAISILVVDYFLKSPNEYGMFIVGMFFGIAVTLWLLEGLADEALESRRMHRAHVRWLKTLLRPKDGGK